VPSGAGEAFHGGDLRAIRLHGQHEAAAHGLALDDHRAGAADAMFASDMYAGVARIAAQEIGE